MLNEITVAVVISVICLVISTMVAIIGYFLKQTMSRVQAVEDETKEIKQNYEPVKSHEKDMEKINEKLESIDTEVKGFKSTFLEKEDFIRSMAEINHKFDRMDDKLDRVLDAVSKKEV